MDPEARGHQAHRLGEAGHLPDHLGGEARPAEDLHEGLVEGEEVLGKEEEGLLLQGPKGHPGPRGQGVGFGQGHHDGHPEEGLLRHLRVLHLEPREAVVQAPLLEGPDLLGGVHLQNLHRLAEPPAQVVQEGHEVGEEVLRHPEAEGLLPRPPDRLLEGLQLLKEPRPFPAEQIPRRGQAEGAPFQKAHPELPLQGLDPLGEGGLGEVEALRSLVEALFLRQDQEGLEAARVHDKKILSQPRRRSYWTRGPPRGQTGPGKV